MIDYLGARLSRMLVTLWVIATAVFLATRMTGNPIDFLMPEGLDAQSRAEMIAYFGLDKPLLNQYISFWKSLMDGEFGLGLMERRSVAVIFGERVWRSVSLLSATLAVTVGVGVPLGVVAAVWRNTTIGNSVLLIAFIGYAIPNFVLAILFLLAFSFSLQCLRVMGQNASPTAILPRRTLLPRAQSRGCPARVVRAPGGL
jgi:peptide/nickel transport system permease protein